MRQKREGGSVLGFIVIAIVLVGLLVGGALFVQQQSKHKPFTAPTVVEQPKEEGQEPAEQSAPASPAPTPQQNSSTAQSSPRELPQGGPADAALTVVMIGILVGVIISFMQSRRRLAPL